MTVRARAAALTLGLALGIAPGAALQAAPETLDDCDALVLRRPDDVDSYTCYGRLARGPAQVADAIRRLEAHLALDADNARARAALAYLDRLQGGDRAESFYRRAIEGFVREAARNEEIATRVFLANLLAQEGRPDEAAAELDRAAEAAARLGEPELEAFVGLERARAYNRTSDFRTAERILREIEPRLDEAEPRSRAAWCSVLGYSYWGQRRRALAVERFREQAELLAEAGAVYEEAGARYNLLLLHDEMSPARRRTAPGELREEWAALLALAERSGNDPVASVAHLNVAVLDGKLGRPIADRRAHLRRAMELAQRVPDRLDAVRALGVSLVLEEPRDEERGLASLHRAIEEGRASGRPSVEALGQMTLARVLRAQAVASGWRPAERARALEASIAALDRVEALRHRQPEHLTRARVFARWASAYDEFAATFLHGSGTGGPAAPEDLEIALQVLERKRAQVLLDELDAARVPLYSDAAEVAERAALVERLNAVQRALLEGPAGDERAQLLRELDSLEEREAALRLRLTRIDETDDRASRRRPPTLERIRAALRPDEAILSYLSEHGGDENVPSSWVTIHTRDGDRALPTPPAEEVGPAIELLLGLVGNRTGDERAGAARLHDGLVAPALAELPPGIERLIVIPDGPLHRLPFPLLRSDPGEAPLGARYRISTSPSIATWLRWRRGGDLRNDTVLALADPAIGGVSVSVAIDRAGRPETLGPLPHARRETRALDRSLGGVHTLVGAEASESALKRLAAAPIALLHVGAHAVVDDARPERSAILLAPGNAAEDGLLQSREIVDLRPGPQVVVLSACRSVSGEVLDGEGPMSLARPFFVAGARAVLGSLWPLRDDEAATFFTEFYRHVGAGASLDSALAATRRERLEAGAPPAAWAGVVLVGDGTLIPFPGGAPDAGRHVWPDATVVTSTAGLVGALAGLLLLGRRRSVVDDQV